MTTARTATTRAGFLATPFRCPLCGGALVIDPACRMTEAYAKNGVLVDGEPAWRVKVAPAALCTCCEFCIEVGGSYDAD